MYRVLSGFLGCILSIAVQVCAKDVPMTAEYWQLEDEGASFVEHQGRNSIKFVGNSYASFLGKDFQNGVIEFDIYLRNKSGFPGIHFREESKGNAEVFYLRPDVPNVTEATQYNPAFNSLFAWQLYTGDRFGAPANYKYDDWNRVKLVISGTQMDVYINSDAPILHIPSLARGDQSGGIRLQGARDLYYVSNVKIERNDSVEIVGTAEPMKPFPAGLVEQFEVGMVAIDSAEVEGKLWLDPDLLKKQTWAILPVNELGMANLARVSGRKKGADTLLVRMKAHADSSKFLKLRYGFSDRIMIFVNGKAIVQGDETFGTRSPAYYGAVGLYSKVFLPLHKGENEVVLAVSEGFGGWGLMAALEEQAGVSIR